VQGIQGDQGATGATGPQGIQGVQGDTGATGLTGETGPVGATGLQGPTGAQGVTGATGIQGIQGVTGETGATGVQGPIGETGPQGVQGPIGATGPQGDVGQTGATGLQGIQGPIGETGPIGVTGATGPIGSTGPVGETGPVGQTGATGPMPTGAITNIDSISTPDYITFDTTPETSTTTAGTLFWDNGDAGMNLILNANVTTRIGQNEFVLVTNNTANPITKGSVVYITGAAGQKPTIGLADADTEATSSKTLGFAAETIANGADGYVITFGIIRGIDTLGLTEGASVWLSQTAGGYTTIMPVQPAHSVYLGVVVRAHQTAGEILVKVQNGYELQELHNVKIDTGTLANGHVIAYNSTSQLWENTSAVGPQGATGPTGPIGATGVQGPTGVTGETGPQGPQGIQGIQGVQGATGPIGVTGATGVQGPTGVTGTQGATGPTGPAGPGLPVGGVAGDYVKKLSSTNYDVGFASLTGEARTFTASQRGTLVTDNDGSFDMNGGNNFSCTPAAGITLTFTNITSGQSGFVLLVNTGGHTIAAAATTKVASGSLAAISAAGTYLLSYFSNGTNVFVVNSGALS
jgi:hypothetical protein